MARTKQIKNRCRSYLVVISALFISNLFAQHTWVDSISVDGNSIRMKVNHKTGVPNRVAGLVVNFNRYGVISENNIQELSKSFLAEHAPLFKITPGSLKFEKAGYWKDRWHVSFIQEKDGVPVFNSNVAFTIFSNGNVPLVGVNYYPNINIDTTPILTGEKALDIARTNFTELSQADSIGIRKEPELMILPIEGDKSYSYFLVYHVVIDSEDPRAVFSESYFINAGDGQVMRQYSNLVSADVSGYVTQYYWEEHYTDPTDINNFPTVKIKNVIGLKVSTSTDENGYYEINSSISLPWQIILEMENAFVKVYDDEDPVVYYYTSMFYPPHEYSWTVPATHQTNIFKHVNIIHDYFKGPPFNYGGMDYQMHATIHDFFPPGARGIADGHHIRFDTFDGWHWDALSDVIYHEYTHNVIYHLYGHEFIREIGGSEGAAMDEGLSDYFSSTLNNDSNQGEPTNYQRDLNNTTRQWNPSQDAHWNGIVIGGACWNLRDALGATYVDELVFEALKNPNEAANFEDFALNVLVADDNDGDLDNGTPHYDEIEEAFETNHDISVYDPSPLSVNITGPSGLRFKQWGTFTANVSGGSGTISYQWYMKQGSNPYWEPRGAAQTQSVRMSLWDITMKVVVTRGSLQAEDQHICYNYDMPKAIPPGAVEIPFEYALAANHPNPFNPATTIRYDLPEASRLTLVIYDMMGREVKSWRLQETAGYKQVVWDGKDQGGRLAPAGIYIYRFITTSVESDKRFRASRKMVLLK